MKTILIPVDFSEHAAPTYKFATRLAGTVEKTRLFFFHSFNDQLLIPDSTLNSGFDNDTFMNMQLIEEFKEQAENNISQLKTEVEIYLSDHSLTNFIVETLVEGGDPKWEITSVRKDINADLIIMGTQGTGKKGILEGSMAKKIMDKAITPVIAVPSGKYDHEKLKIMYASNNSDKDYAKIMLLFKLFENLHFEIFVAHFHFESNRHDLINQISELKEAFSKEIIENKIHFSIVDTDNKDISLETFVDSNSINAVAFIAHKSNFFKSLFKHKINKNDFFKLGLPMIALHE
jgi:nucleotide-binding universal stress UspA family protein